VEQVTINLKVDSDIKRRFRIIAAEKDLKLNELFIEMVKSFAAIAWMPCPVCKKTMFFKEFVQNGFLFFQCGNSFCDEYKTKYSVEKLRKG